MSLYLLKLVMDQVDTLHVGKYWSEVLCCPIMTHLGDLEVKVTDLKKVCVRVFDSSFYKSISLEVVDGSSLYFACW